MTRIRDNRGVTSREQLLDDLIDTGRHLVARGLVQASGGNLSARLPDSDRFLITGAGTWLDRLTSEDFCELTPDGGQVDGSRRPPVRRFAGRWPDRPLKAPPSRVQAANAPPGHPVVTS